LEEPYRFLDYYEESDRSLFFARERETELLLSDVIATQLVVLFAKTGSGKTSLINAGVRPRLEKLGYATFYVRVEQDPTEAARKALMEYPEIGLPIEREEESLATLLESVVRQLHKRIVVFFDQFEEFFTRISGEHPDKAQRFVSEIARVCRNRKSGVHIVFSMREEYFHEMDAFRGEIPSIFHKDSNLRLRGFDEDQARDAIVRPAEKFGTEVEEGLVKLLTSDLLMPDLVEHGRIEPTLLQIVCDTLWRRKKSDEVIGLGDYERLGRAKGILDRRLEEDIRSLDYEQLWLFEKLLPELKTERNTKCFRGFDLLVGTLKTDEPSLRGLIDKLKRLRLLREREFDGKSDIEWMSDYLAERTDYLQECVDAISLQQLLQLLEATIHEPDLPDDVVDSTDEQLQDEALSKFYDSAAKKVAEETDIKEEDLREWFSTSLITPAGKRERVYRETSGIPHQALDILKDLHFIREESQDGARSYRLAHDRLIAPIKASNQEWLKERVGADQIRRKLEDKAKKWATGDKSEDNLLDKAELSQADSLADSDLSLSRTLLALVEASRVAIKEADQRREREEQQLRRRVKQGIIAAIIFGLLAILAVTLAGYALSQRQIAQEQAEIAEARRIEAEEAEEKAIVAKETAEAASQSAEERRIEAEEAEKTASAAKEAEKAQKRSALEAKAEAERQREIAFARQLSAQSASVMDQQADLLQRSVILAAESMQRYPSAEADQVLRSGLALLPHLAARLEHEGNVIAVAFSSDGKYLATASQGGTARVWDVTSHEEVVSIKHGKAVNAIVFSPNGEYLATASDDNTARVCETTSGREVARMEHEDWVNTVSFSPDGKYLATASDDSTARVWEAISGQEVALIKHEDRVNDVAFSPDGRHLATASDDNTARVWEAISGKEVASVEHEDRVNAVAFSPDGRYFASGSRDTTARVWETASGEEVISFRHERSVNVVAFSPKSGEYLITAGDDNAARVWHIVRHQEVACMKHELTIKTVVFSPDGKYLATASWDKTARVWETTSGREMARIIHGDIVNTVNFSPDGKYLATGSRDNTLQVCDMSSSQEVARIIHEGLYNTIILSPDGNYLATVSQDNTATVWNINTGSEAAQMEHESTVNVVVFSHDGGYLATASDDKVTRVWDIEGDQEVAKIGHHSIVNAVAFSPDGRYLATASWDNAARIWDIASGQEVISIKHERGINAIAFSPNGQYLATASDDGIVRLWHTINGREIALMKHDDKVNTIAFSPDGGYLATASDDSTARLWHTINGREILLMKHDDKVNAVAFSSDGKYLATASDDKTARVWEKASGREVARIKHERIVSVVVFSPGGQYLATASGGNTAWMWLWRQEELMKAASSRVIRNLTTEEWHQYLGNESYRKTFPDRP
jgi:WD40 repeat protein